MYKIMTWSRGSKGKPFVTIGTNGLAYISCSAVDILGRNVDFCDIYIDEDAKKIKFQAVQKPGEFSRKLSINAKFIDNRRGGRQIQISIAKKYYGRYNILPFKHDAFKQNYIEICYGE